MNYYFAPMEGITGYIYRNAHHKFFPETDGYYSPFLVANHTKNFKSAEKKDVFPENNPEIRLVPQILTKDPQEFLWAALSMRDLGYGEVNLNLGCPMPTVYSKGKGAGFLKDPEGLDLFFASLFREMNALPRERRVGISVKTRLGAESFDEEGKLLDIFARYPFEKIIVHPRTGIQRYGGTADRAAFGRAMEQLTCPVIYNGDILTVSDAEELCAEFPEISGIMIGRGLLANPALVRMIRGGEALSKKELQAFHDELVRNYTAALGSEKTVLKKMKELWAYLGRLFPENEKERKDILKAQTMVSYKGAVRVLIGTGKLHQ